MLTLFFGQIVKLSLLVLASWTSPTRTVLSIAPCDHRLVAHTDGKNAYCFHSEANILNLKAPNLEEEEEEEDKHRRNMTGR